MAEDRHDGGGKGPFSFTFPSIKQEHIKVSVNNSDPGSSAYFFNSYNSTTGGSIEFYANTTQGTKNVRIYRKTDGDNLEHTFQVGSSIKASDLNDSNKQALFLAEENRESINSLAAGDATGAVQISGSNIADNSITTGKILDLEVKSGDIASHNSDDTLRAITTDHIRDNAVTTSKIPDNNVTANKLKSSSSTDSDRAVTTNHIRDGAVTDAKVSSGITGTKITPDFGNQNISTTGTLNTGTTTTGSTTAQDLTVSGNATFNNGISTNGKDVYTANAAFISSDTSGHFADRSNSTNVDHIWHDETNNEWNFCSDTGYKSAGNSTIKAASFLGSGANLSGLAVQEVKIDFDTSERNFGNNSSWHTHLEVGPFTNVTNSSKFLVVAVYEIKNESNSTNCSTEARITEVGGTLTPNATNTRQGNSYQKFTHIEIDRANNSSNRTYNVQCRATNSHTSCNAFMDNAFLAVFHLKPS